MSRSPELPRPPEYALKRLQKAGRGIGERQPLLSWQTITLTGGWTASGAPYAPPQFYKDRHGRVHLRGRVVPPGSPAGTVLLTLPEGYRTEYLLPMMLLGGGSQPGVVHCDLDTDGTLTYIARDAGIVTLSWLSLDAHFRGAQFSGGGTG